MLMLSNAQWSGNVKKGVRLKLADFEPRYCKVKEKLASPEVREARLKMQLNALAKTQKPNGQI